MRRQSKGARRLSSATTAARRARLVDGVVEVGCGEALRFGAELVIAHVLGALDRDALNVGARGAVLRDGRFVLRAATRYILPLRLMSM